MSSLNQNKQVLQDTTNLTQRSIAAYCFQ